MGSEKSMQQQEKGIEKQRKTQQIVYIYSLCSNEVDTKLNAYDCETG